MIKPEKIKLLYVSLSIIVGCIIISMGIRSAQGHKKFKCLDFKTRKDAQKAYEKGATYLDKNKDKIACNNLK